MKNCKFLSIILGLLPGCYATADEPAYREQIITPHWIERTPHVGGTVEALFLVNDLARREPDELAQRFDINAEKVRTLRGSNAYKNVFDLDHLANGLKGNPDVLVVSASNPWKDLGPKGRGVVVEWLNSGGNVVVFMRGDPKRDWNALFQDDPVEPGEMQDLTADVTGNLDLKSMLPVALRNSFRVVRVNSGKGKIWYASPVDRAYTRFNAFFPKIGSWEDPAAVRETSFLVAHRLVRAAAGKPPMQKMESPKISITGREVNFSADEPVSFSLFTGAGQRLAKSELSKRGSFKIPAVSNGPLTLIWEHRTRDKTGSFGSAYIEVSPFAGLNVLPVKSPLSRREPVSFQWTVDDEIRNKPGVSVEVQIYDPDRNLLRFASAPAQAGSLTVEAWETQMVTCLARILLIENGSTILDEDRQWIHIETDPGLEERQWTALTWLDERGGLAERWRAFRLRELGLNAAATLGINESANLWASASGLRIIPTNVFVPQNRYNQGKFDEAKTKARFAEFAGQLREQSPLGYSFADEPPKDVILPWLEEGAGILASVDPEARFGYCGVWPGAETPELMAKSGYLGLYSPGHLYNLNVWLGVERDIYRSFRRLDGIVTCWTHYAPWADHEPYSRTVPWLWLFDELDGVGYFKSAGMMFGILDGDLQSTHETRWWSEEIRELNAGVAEQVKRLPREKGTVRIGFGGDLKAVEPWSRALNELSIPWCFIDATKITAGDLNGVKLLIYIDGGTLTKEISEFVSAGGTLIAGGNLASNTTEEKRATFNGIFGFDPAETASGAGSEFAGIRSSVIVPGDILLEGRTTGESLPQGGEPWQSIGGLNPAKDAENIPENLLTIANASGYHRGPEGRAVYFGLQPDKDSIKRWLPSLLKDVGVSPPRVQLQTPEGVLEDRIYTYRFGEGATQLIGLVPDYIKIPAARQLRDSSEKQQGYFQHGPQRWDAVSTVLKTGRETHLYNVRKGEYLGPVSEKVLSIQPGRPELFALLSCQPPELTMQAAEKCRAGSDLALTVQLEIPEAAVSHVVRVAFLDAADMAIWTANLHAEDGRAEARFSIPHHTSPGKYRLRARDILTGVEAEHIVTVEAAAQNPVLPLAPIDFRIEKTALDWPEGEWEPVPPDDAGISLSKLPAKAVSKVPSRKAINYGKFNGKVHLSTDFALENGLRRYDLRYLVCCDPAVFDAGPPQRVSGLNGSGLGIRKPGAHHWYYNSYLKIFLEDDEMVLDYELARITDLSDATVARLRLEWETPSAVVHLEYAMIPGHEGLFHRLNIMPRSNTPITRAKVNLYSYPAGFGKGGKPFFEIAQENREWLLMGDAVRDRDFYETGRGSAGLLVRPEEWANLKYGSRPGLKAERSEATAGDLWTLHWVTWIFPERGNAAAREYMQTNSESTMQKMSEVFTPTAVQ